MVVAAAAIAADQLERARCESQTRGSGANRPGSDCEYKIPTAQSEFRFAIDDGSERLLYLSGGTTAGPETLRLVRGGSVVIERPTHVLTGDNIDVCRNQPPIDARWWSIAIDDATAAAIRRSDPEVRVEALIGGSWQPVHLHDSGCLWHGHG